jgi:hypothetical protein
MERQGSWFWRYSTACDVRIPNSSSGHIFTAQGTKGRDGCYYSNAERGGDLDLPFFLGTQGLIEAANWIDLGSAWDEEYRGPEVENLREWAVIFRRLHLPYYEEARPYLEQAKAGGEFGDNNEVSFYLPETLKEIIKYYTEE